jgi:hypothetical protein
MLVPRESLSRLARRSRRAESRTPALEAGTVITLRLVPTEGDAAIDQLAELSGLEPPVGPSLVAEVDGEPRAALSLAGGEVLSDPFHPAAELGSLLCLRLAQLGERDGGGSDLRCA